MKFNTKSTLLALAALLLTVNAQSGPATGACFGTAKECSKVCNKARTNGGLYCI